MPLSPPPDEMARRSERLAKQAVNAVTMQIVTPDKPTSQKKTKFKSGSSWTKKELHMLRVRFSRDTPEDGFNWDELFDTAGAIPANIQER